MSFKKGGEWNGNRSGRPVGTGHRQQTFNALVMPHKEELLAKAVNLALDGNEAMLRLFIERLIPPKPIDEPVTINLPDQLTIESTMGMGKSIIDALNNGEVTPEQAKSLMSVMMTYQGYIDGHELLQRYKELHSSFETMKLKKTGLNDRIVFTSNESEKKGI